MPPAPSRRPRASPTFRRPVLLSLALVVLALFSRPAAAQIGSDRYSSIVIQATDGSVLSAVNPDEPRYPASLTKMMTLYLTFEALRDRRVTLDQLVPVSQHAASMIPSKLGLLPATRITVEQSIEGLVTKSANDAAAALAELVAGGDEDRFAQAMTLRARALGMARTTFRNASGLPDPAQVSTARDFAVLARHLVTDFPVQYRYFSIPGFVFHGRMIPNHDHLLQSYPGADGIKTGYTEASGFNLVTSAVRGDTRLIGVVMGAARSAERDLHMEALLDNGFATLNIPVLPRREAPLTLAGRFPPLGNDAAARAQLLAAQAGLSSRPPVPDQKPIRPASRWAVQVGAFGSEDAARRAANAARRIADLGEVRVETVLTRGRSVYHAQLTGLSPQDARAACVALARRRMACAPIRVDGGQVASR